MFVHVPPIPIDVFDGRSRDQAALRPGVLVPGSVVIRVEQIRVVGIGRAVVRHRGFEEERFKEPADMGKVPFGWTAVRHRLDDVILDGQWRTQAFAEPTYLLEALDERW